MKQMDMFSAEEARDHGLELVLENSGVWKQNAKACLRRMWFYREFTGEDIRHYLTKRCGVPHHSNAWGAIVRWANVQRIVRKTGRTAKMRDVQSHARENPIYVMGSNAICPNPQNNL